MSPFKQPVVDTVVSKQNILVRSHLDANSVAD